MISATDMIDPRYTLVSEPEWRTIAGLSDTATADDLRAMNDSLDAENARLDDRLDEVRAQLAICQRAYDQNRHLEEVAQKVQAFDAELARKDAEEGRYGGGLFRQMKCQDMSSRLINEMAGYLKARDAGEARWMKELELKMARQDKAEGGCTLRTLWRYVENRRRKARNQVLAKWYMGRQALVEKGYLPADTSIQYSVSNLFPKTRRQESRVTEF